MIKAFRSNIPNLYYLSLALVVCGLSTSIFLMSLGTIILVSVWVLEGNFSEKRKLIFTDRRIQWLIGFFLIHVAALIYTSNFEYGFKDIRVKLPLLVFPLIIGTIRLPDKRKTDGLLLLFIGAVLFSTLYSFLVYKNVIAVERDISDPRTISRFISHIRLSMNVCMVFLLLIFYFRDFSFKMTILKVIIFAWLFYFLYILESATGIMILFSCVLVGCAFYAVNAKRALYRSLSVSMLAFILITIGLSFYIIVSNYYQPRDLDISNLDKRTAHGEVYQHDTTNLQLENGYYIWLYVAPVELEETWNEKSEYAYNDLDKKGQPVKWTLIRYMTSKGLRKDKDGVNALSKEDISNIENGVTSVDTENSSGLVRRIKVILYEFDSYFRGITPNGNSVTQRFEYWRVGWNLFRNNFIIGVGTGDVNDEYRKQYRRDKSELIYKYRNRAHNQFLTVLISFGIVGFAVFVISMIIPFYKTSLGSEILYILFFTLMIVAMMGEDTLETQAGVIFISLFNSLLIFQIFNDSEIKGK